MRKQAYLALVAAVAAVALQAQAATYTWVPTAAGTTYDWNVAANWGGVAFPVNAGDVANLNIDLGGNQTIRLQQAISLGTLNIGEVADGLQNYTIQSGTGTNTLTFDSGVANTAAVINVPSAGTLATNLNAPLALNSDLNINLAASTTAGARAALSLGGNVTLNGKTIKISGGYKGATNDGTQMTLGGADTLIGNGTIINNSDSPLVITGQKLAFTGTLIANGQAVGQDGNTGTITLNSASVKNAAEIIVNGAHNSTTHLGGKLQIGTGSTGATPPANQRLTQNRITLNGGLFHDGGVPLSTTVPAGGNFTVYQADTVANLDFNSGFSQLTVTASNTTAGNLLTTTTVERGDGATAFFRAPNTQTSTSDPARPGPTGYTYYSRWFAGNGANLVVGSTATGDVNTRVIPWLMASVGTSNFNLDNFATYDAAEGVRVLRTGEFTSTLTNGANIKTGSLSNMTQDWTFNALMHNGGVQTPNRTITLLSGGLILSNTAEGGFGNHGNTNGLAGTLNFPVEAVIMNGANTNHISSKIIAPEGLTKGGFGRLILTGPVNEIAGPVHVSGGVLQVGDGTYDSSIGEGDVFVHGGAVLDIRVAGATNGSLIDIIGDNAVVDLYSSGFFTGQINIGAGIDTVSTLKLGGVFMPTGYYGSTAAIAANPTLTIYTSDSYFAGTGLLQVVPEPGIVGLAVFAAAATLIRRRRAQ